MTDEAFAVPHVLHSFSEGEVDFVDVQGIGIPRWLGDSGCLSQWDEAVMAEDPPMPFSPFSLTNCTMLSHFSFNDFVAIAFLDLAGDLDIQI